MAGTHKAGKISGFCPRYHRAVELIGRRWTGAIVRALMAGRSRFNEIAAEVPGVSSRLLSERLRELEDCGIVTRAVDPGPPVKVTYALTTSGTELDATVRALAAWAERWIPAERNGRSSRHTKRP
jgi:DNA-binding HxlR family transcriptional regulator